MKYNIDNIDPDNGFVYFWKDTPKNKIGPNCLSQWYESSFTDNERTYKNAEQYMMSQKAKIFGDNIAFEKIMQANHPAEFKAIGREVKNYNDKVWNSSKCDIVLNGTSLKFKQNEKLLQYLLSTGNKILVEASPYDRIWGIGMDENHIDADYPEAWKGKNLLGFILMEFRDSI